MDFPAFRQRWPWIGPDLQNIAYEVLAKYVDRKRWPPQRIEVPVDDGTGDRLVHFLHRPHGDDVDADAPPRPTVVMSHGLGGSADAGYMWLAAEHLLEHGFPVVRCNRRGCGEGVGLASEVAWHGDTAGIGATVRWLRDHAAELALPCPRVAVLGFSLGGNTLVQWLADDAPGSGRDAVVAAATISAPVDMDASSRCLDRWRNIAYRPYILKKLRDEVLRKSADLTSEQRDAVSGCRSMWDYAQKFNAPRKGYDSAEAYLAVAHLGDRLPRVGVPLLMIHSRDDPWVPHASYDEIDWSPLSHVTTLFTDRGGHMGFHGRGSTTPWSVECVATFFEKHAQPRSERGR